MDDITSSTDSLNAPGSSLARRAAGIANSQSLEAGKAQTVLERCLALVYTKSRYNHPEGECLRQTGSVHHKEPSRGTLRTIGRLLLHIPIFRTHLEASITSIISHQVIQLTSHSNQLHIHQIPKPLPSVDSTTTPKMANPNNAAAPISGQALAAMLHDDIACSVCTDPIFVPATLECGHSTCYPCMKRWICGDPAKPRAPFFKCPMCASAFKQQPTPNFALKNVVDTWFQASATMLTPATHNILAQAKQQQTQVLQQDQQQDRLFNGVFDNDPPKWSLRHLLIAAALGIIAGALL